MKIVVLVIASRGPAYDRFLENWRAQILPANISVKYLFCSEDQASPFEVCGDSIFLKGRECVKPALHYKTLAAMSHSLLEPFDYLLRTNLSSYINFRKLNEFLEEKPRDFCAAGTYFEGGFLSGSGYILTRDLVEKFLGWCEDSCEMNPMCHHDDEIMGTFVKQLQPTFYQINGITYDPTMSLEEAAQKLHLRFKTSCIEEEREADIEQHREVIEMYNKADEAVFYIAHYCSDRNTVILLNYCVRSIQQFYPGSQIIICESKSEFKDQAYDISGAIWIDSPLQNSSCVGCFKDFLERYKNTKKKAIFLHDSMMLKSRFIDERLERPFGFIWHFTVFTEPRHLASESLGKFLFTRLSSSDMDYTDYAGCFGIGLYGDYASIEKLWKAVPFEEFIQTEERKKLMVDLERIVGAVSFEQGLVGSIEDCSLCGDIFDFPKAMRHHYTGQTYNDLQAYPYNGSALKIWGKRFNA